MFSLFYKLCFPKIRIKISNKVSKSKWITKGLKISCKTKRSLRFKYYLNKCSSTKTKYKTYTKLLRDCINQSIRNRNFDMILSSKNVCKTSWQLIKQESEANKQMELIDNIKKGDVLLSNSYNIAQAFNEYFINLSYTKYFIHDTCQSNLNNSIFLSPFSFDEIYRIIISLNNTNAEGYDEIGTKILKACAREITPVLTHLIKIVKPLYKKGDKTSLGNYRPLALISILSKKN